jgi:Domain of unknown function (DUF4252)
MLKFITTIAVLLATNLFFGQSMFDKYDGLENVTAIIVNNKMFDLMSKIKPDTTDKEAQQFMSFIKKLDNLKVFTTTSVKMTADMKLTSEKYLKTASLEELMRVNDGGKNIKIYVKEGSASSKIKELFMFIEGSGSKENQTVIMSLTGDFDLDEISALTNKMNLPGGEALKKAAKK